MALRNGGTKGASTREKAKIGKLNKARRIRRSIREGEKSKGESEGGGGWPPSQEEGGEPPPSQGKQRETPAVFPEKKEAS